MPDIIEENEGEGRSPVELRAIRAAALAQAQALAARARRAAAAREHQGADNNNNAPPVAVPPGGGENEGGAVAAANGNGANAGNNNNNDAPPPAVAAELAEVGAIAAQCARLSMVDVRPMFRRLGVRRPLDIRYIRERDLDGIPRITQIQKRKLWAIMKYCATIEEPLTARTTLGDIAKALNLNKKKEKENTSSSSTTTTPASASSTSATAAASSTSAWLPLAVTGVVPLVHSSKLDHFDGNHSKWVLWKNKARYCLAQTEIGPLLNDDNDEEAQQYAKKHAGLDHLLFNMLAEAIVGGSAQHLIAKAERQSQAPPAAAAPPPDASSTTTTTTNTKKAPASGRTLWLLLKEEYSEGPRKFWILSDARQVLQKLRLVGPDHETYSNNSNKSDKDEGDCDKGENDDNNEELFVSYSANNYSQRFRSAKETLEEFDQALPDQFLASTFIEHIEDERLESVKKQLLQEITSKNMTLDACITELLMSDHILRARQRNGKRKSTRHNNSNAGRRKRTLEEAGESGDECVDVDASKRPKVGDDKSAAAQEKDTQEEPDEATS